MAAGEKGTEGRAPWSGIIALKAHQNAGGCLGTNSSMLSLALVNKDIF